MGLFSGGNSKSTKNETNTQLHAAFQEVGGPVSNLQLDGITAKGKYAQTNMNFNLTDQGAVKGAFDLGSKAMDFGGKALNFAGDANRASLNFAGDMGRAAINESGNARRDSLNFAGDMGRAAINESGNARRDSLNFGNDAMQKALEFARQASVNASETVADTNRNFTNKFSEFANRQSSSSDQRVTDIAKWALGAGAAFMAFNAWKNRGRA